MTKDLLYYILKHNITKFIEKNTSKEVVLNNLFRYFVSIDFNNLDLMIVISHKLECFMLSANKITINILLDNIQ